MPDFRAIPSIDLLRQRPGVRALEARFGAAATVDALRRGADAMRLTITAGTAGPPDEVADRIEASASSALDSAFSSSLPRVVNATGVIVHTNLGRAPLAQAAVERVGEAAGGYAALEYDLTRGERGRRDVHAERLLCHLTGGQAAVVVNNNAAATLLLLAALARGREVIVSRGELVEIGGGFRVPDVMAQSGALLREVGTTNKTRVADYAAAISDRTALILRVHPSNFRIEGFTERPPLGDLVALGRRFGIPVIEDIGSGHLGGWTDVHPLARLEPSVDASIACGVDACCFSGDKLLGGPQAGIIVGRTQVVERLREHPLLRALRADKMTYAALEATLGEYAAGRAAQTVPVQRMLMMTSAYLRGRAETVAADVAALSGWRADIVAGMSAVGGGSAPGVELPTWLVAVEPAGVTADALAAALRRMRPPIIARIDRDRVVLDLRTVAEADEHHIVESLKEIATGGVGGPAS
jgi:L-seryl-tRNA(Ser) seleniumtransferase